jgi:L-ascorbate metabolism protein UlaG (beta-lactamase superfamily)
MAEKDVYLRPDIQIEPLIDSWYAWSHIIAPATAARNLTERHLKIMESYLSAPQIHAKAVQNPQMLGGPFIDYKGGRVDEIAALRDKTRQKRSHMLALSKALEDLDRMLKEEARGYTLQPLYSRVPNILRGYVELVYDLNNQPSFRLIEPLIYKSQFYNRDAQSVAFSITNGDERPFVLSTPRLPDESVVFLETPFSNKDLDELFKLKFKSQPLKTVRDKVGFGEQVWAAFEAFLTQDSQPAFKPYLGTGARWRYFGHACILLETTKVNILFDPVLSYSYENATPRYTYHDLPDRIDYVVITHNHQDHILFETLLQIRHKIGCIIVPPSTEGSLQDPSLKLILKHCGFVNVIEMHEMDQIEIPSGSITALPFLGEHADLNIRSKLAYAVRLGRHLLLFAADSCNIEPELYRHVQREIGDVDVIFLGMECDGAPLTWLYGPLLTRPVERAMSDSRRLSGSDYKQAINIVDICRCKEVYVYAMGQEPWLNYVMSVKYTDQSRPIMESNQLISDCRSRGMCAERLFGEKEILLS